MLIFNIRREGMAAPNKHICFGLLSKRPRVAEARLDEKSECLDCLSDFLSNRVGCLSY
jgi:hypothetical protein